MGDVKQRIEKALSKIGIEFVELKTSTQWCVYCGLPSPDFSVNKKSFHIECLITSLKTSGACPSCELGLCPDGVGGFIPCTICGNTEQPK